MGEPNPPIKRDREKRCILELLYLLNSLELKSVCQGDAPGPLANRSVLKNIT